jgi:adenine-specific DNA-methyltransferase
MAGMATTNMEVPSRATTDSLTRLAAEQQRRFDAMTLPRARKERGHFGTSPAIADFMAGMFSAIPHGPMRILDPGAGVGTLSAAVCQRILRQHSRRRLSFELFENDPKLIPLLEKTMTLCKRVLGDAGHEMRFVIRVEDFILSNAHESLFQTAPDASFHLAILNPPYFKVRKESAHAQAMMHVVHGQPNIYAFFMAVVANLLRDQGQMVAITPRSYFNGPYFKRFRKWFFDRMTARQIHIFESRTDAFREEEVLQENVILLAEKASGPKDVLVTSSTGRDFQQVDRHVLPYRKVIEDSTGDHLVRVATSGFEQEIVHAVDGLPLRFRELPFNPPKRTICSGSSENQAQVCHGILRMKSLLRSCLLRKALTRIKSSPKGRNNRHKKSLRLAVMAPRSSTTSIRISS